MVFVGALDCQWGEIAGALRSDVMSDSVLQIQVFGVTG